MRFYLMIFLVLILGSAIFADSGFAAVTGRCDLCHTMHNSQNGATMRGGAAGISGASGEAACISCHADLRDSLLRQDCMGCHVATASFNIDPVTLAPQVAHNASDLASGNFTNVFWDDPKGHNVHGISDAIEPLDVRFLDPDTLEVVPPGYTRAYDPSTVGYNLNQGLNYKGLMCAGANGCHGNRNEVSLNLAMRGTHHADDSMLKFGATFNANAQGADAGFSYRMLRGVRGGEVAGWANVNSVNHNEYSGEQFAARLSQSYADLRTISDFCASCHGIFHMSGTGGIGTGGSPWLRHPVDVSLPVSGEYADYITYDPETPVARSNLSAVAGGPSSDVQGNAVVMCLSCHKAHASGYDSILRWDYNNLAQNEGCKRCHSNK